MNKIKFPEPSTINPKLVRGKGKYAQKGSMVFEFRALGFSLRDLGFM